VEVGNGAVGPDVVVPVEVGNGAVGPDVVVPVEVGPPDEPVVDDEPLFKVGALDPDGADVPEVPLDADEPEVGAGTIVTAK
jgi:hypothetical protein